MSYRTVITIFPVIYIFQSRDICMLRERDESEKKEKMCEKNSEARENREMWRESYNNYCRDEVFPNREIAIAESLIEESRDAWER